MEQSAGIDEIYKLPNKNARGHQQISASPQFVTGNLSVCERKD